MGSPRVHRVPTVCATPGWFGQPLLVSGLFDKPRFSRRELPSNLHYYFIDPMCLASDIETWFPAGPSIRAFSPLTREDLCFFMESETASRMSE